MQKVKTQRFGEFCKKNMIIYFYMVIIKKYKVKNILLKISGKTGINFRKFSGGNFQKFPNSQP